MSRQNYVYQNLFEVTQQNKESVVFTFGIILECSSPRQTKGPDMYINMHITDKHLAVNSQDQELEILLFAPMLSQFPRIQCVPGDIIRIHRAKVDEYNGKKQLGGKIGKGREPLHIAIFSCNEQTEYETYYQSSVMIHAVDEHQRKIIDQLREYKKTIDFSSRVDTLAQAIYNYGGTLASPKELQVVPQLWTQVISVQRTSDYETILHIWDGSISEIIKDFSYNYGSIYDQDLRFPNLLKMKYYKRHPLPLQGYENDAVYNELYDDSYISSYRNSNNQYNDDDNQDSDSFMCQVVEKIPVEGSILPVIIPESGFKKPKHIRVDDSNRHLLQEVQSSRFESVYKNIEVVKRKKPNQQQQGQQQMEVEQQGQGPSNQQQQQQPNNPQNTGQNQNQQQGHQHNQQQQNQQQQQQQLEQKQQNYQNQQGNFDLQNNQPGIQRQDQDQVQQPPIQIDQQRNQIQDNLQNQNRVQYVRQEFKILRPTLPIVPKCGDWIKLRNVVMMVKDGQHQLWFQKTSRWSAYMENKEQVEKYIKGDNFDMKTFATVPMDKNIPVVSIREILIQMRDANMGLNNPSPYFLRCQFQVIQCFPNFRQNGQQLTNLLDAVQFEQDENNQKEYFYFLQLHAVDSTGEMEILLMQENATDFFDIKPQDVVQQTKSQNQLSEKIMDLGLYQNSEKKVWFDCNLLMLNAHFVKRMDPSIQEYFRVRKVPGICIIVGTQIAPNLNSQ